MKKVFEDFENSTICLISDNVYMVGDFKVKKEFIAISLENIEALYKLTVIKQLN